MRYSVIKRKIRKRLDKIFYRPIEVFVFHAVSDCYDPNLNEKADWSSTADFKERIRTLKKSYQFVSLEEAYGHLKKDKMRSRRLAVLTCDDGFESVLSVLPFLEQEEVPVTLFVNPKYLDGESRRAGYAVAPKYMNREQLFGIQSRWVTIGMHGYEHLDATKQTQREFADSVDLSVEILKAHSGYVPYFAYTWGNHNEETDCILTERGIVPVLCDGGVNYKYRKGISRRPIDSYYLNS